MHQTKILIALFTWFFADQFIVQCFLAPQIFGRNPSFLHSASREQYISYSPNFHRYVVEESQGSNQSTVMLESFLFLDEAEEEYPLAKRVKHQGLPEVQTMAGLGCESTNSFHDSCEYASAEFLSPFKAMLQSPVTPQMSNVIHNLDKKLGAPFLSYFPKDEHDLIRERLLFLLSPICNFKNDQIDPPRLLSDGFGAGFSEAQAASAILALRHLVSFDPVDAKVKKPPFPYFYRQLRVSFEMLDQTRGKLATWLTDCSPSDVATFAYLNSLGITWEQCHLILEAFSLSLLSCDLDGNWDVGVDTSRNMNLTEDTMIYLRNRLRVSPAEMFAMLKTHDRLKHYSYQNLQTKLDFLQSEVNMDSREVKSLAIRSPSVLGLSIAKIDQRLTFFSSDLKLSIPEVKELINKLPSVLHYSISSNLKPKIEFLSEATSISQRNLTRLVKINPKVLGYSLERKLKPNILALRYTFDLSNEELRDVYVKVPQLLSFSWNRTIAPKVKYLEERLGLSETALKNFVLSTPRILVHSIGTSLEPKIAMLVEVAGEAEATLAIQSNPSLLLLSMGKLEQRLGLYFSRNVTFIEAFTKKHSLDEAYARKPLTRRKRERPIYEFVGGSVTKANALQIFPDVETAAQSAGTSPGNMYHILKNGRVYRGKRYVYGNKGDLPSTGISNATTSEKRKSGLDIHLPDDVDVQLHYRKPLLEILREDSSLPEFRGNLGGKWKMSSNTIYLMAFVAGRVYLPEKSGEARGLRRAGGLSVYFPQLAGNSEAEILLQQAAIQCFPNQIMPASKNGTRYESGLLTLGYPYLRPSRNRCALYACRDALRLTVELLSLLDPLSACETGPTVHVDIFTESNHVYELLHNSSALLQWGAHPNCESFTYDGQLSEWQVGSDILYPLARTYFRFVEQDFSSSVGSIPPLLGKEVCVTFRHESEINWSFRDAERRQARESAKNAAKWQYERAQKIL